MNQTDGAVEDSPPVVPLLKRAPLCVKG
jgi:hypothetical protein